jgi:hypothetical protein
MIFTLCYAYATIIQWWRLRTLRNKLNGTLNDHNALLVCSGCTVHDSRKHRSLENLLFKTDNRIACTVVPKQKLNLNQWIAFPKNLRYFPINIKDNKLQIDNGCIFILLQAVLDNYTRHEGAIIQVCSRTICVTTVTSSFVADRKLWGVDRMESHRFVRSRCEN